MINDALMVWITGHRAMGNTLWLLKNRGGDAGKCAGLQSLVASAMRIGGRHNRGK
jgi:hypothetical protein